VEGEDQGLAEVSLHVDILTTGLQFLHTHL
jgi:hypothetical protein